MRLANIFCLVACVGLLCAALPVGAATVTSSFLSFVYDYTVTPATGESIKDFHVFTGYSECDVTHYYSVVMPSGWNFTTTLRATDCVLTWWTEGDPLPVGTPANFGYTHYCAPCCHSWFVTEDGTSDPAATPIDGSWNHSEPCNIPPEYEEDCNGPGLVLSPIYPQPTPVEEGTWGRLKVLYR
ncbi:MAG: hypothetical protein JSW03_01955 [Candidatus Eiseniibacteriota bacterium]|nr:MAG: hypothetical protein JSW03_01955 [Candidatus Eisenbacteria bacterium]